MSYLLVRNIVYSSHPKHLSTEIPIDTKIQVVLRMDLDAIGFKSENVILQDVKGARIVPINVEYKNRVILITPLQPLEQNNHYLLELIGGEKGIQTITGQFLEESWYMEFYTNENTEVKAPIITSPANQTVAKSDVTFEWETQEDVFYYHLQISDSNTFNHILWPSDPDMNVFDGTATPKFEYEDKKRYYARIKTVALNREESAWSETVQFFYKKEEEIDVLENRQKDPAYNLESNSKIKEDELGALQELLKGGLHSNTRLAVKGITVNHGTYNAPIASVKEIHIEFAEPIDPKTINSNTVYLIGERN